MPTISTSQLPPPSCWEEFELISADLLSKEWNDPNVQANGRRGQRQNGVDIRGRNGGTPAGAQCKGKRKWPPKRLTTAEIIREVEKAKAYRPKLSTYMILTTDENDAVLQRFVDELNEHHAASSLFQVQLWGWPEIRRRLENDSGLIRKHYGFVSQAEVLEAVAAMPAEIARLIEALQRPMTIGDPGLQVETTEIASELLIAPERKIMAIDLGTTGARVACIIAGRPIVMEDALGHGKMPSVTGYTPDGRVLVGESGRRLATDFPENVVYAAKRLIGRRYSDPVIQELRQYVPFKIVESDSGDAWIEVLGQARSPSQICRPVLEKLRQTASRWLRFDVRKAMIAVPANYNEAQRAAMRDAAQLAGWEVIRMVSEPTAAAIFHGRGRGDQISVVYDFGGGTFDVSVVDSSLGVYEVLSTDGDTFLGGEDFDLRLQSHVLMKLGIASETLTSLTLRRLKDVCEYAKIELCDQITTEITVPAEIVARGRPAQMVIDRSVLEEITQDIVQKTLDICGRALSIAGRQGPQGGRSPLKITAVDNVFLVGGTTHLPFVEERVAAYFGRAPIAGPRREDAVVLGCALQAAVLSGESRQSGLLIDTIPFSIGIETASGLIARLIDRQTSIPCRNSEAFAIRGAAPPTVSIRLFQGEADFAKDCALLCSFELELGADIPTDFAVVEVTADVDAGGKLTVTAVDKMTERFVSHAVNVTEFEGLSKSSVSVLTPLRHHGVVRLPT